MSEISNEYLFSLLQSGYEFTDLSNPYVQPRVLRILAATRQIIREFLGQSSLNDLMAGLDDLIFILNRGRTVVVGAGEVSQVHGDNIYAEYCDFLVLRSVFEQRLDVIADMKVKSSYNMNQLYMLLALFEFAKSFKLFVECKEKLLAEPMALVEVTTMALNFLIAAQDIISFVHPKLINEVKGGEVEALKIQLSRRITKRQNVGSMSPYDKFYDDNFNDVKTRWEQEKACGLPVTALSIVLNELHKKATKEGLSITKATIKTNLKKRVNVPSEAIVVGAPKSGSARKPCVS